MEEAWGGTDQRGSGRATRFVLIVVVVVDELMMDDRDCMILIDGRGPLDRVDDGLHRQRTTTTTHHDLKLFFAIFVQHNARGKSENDDSKMMIDDDDDDSSPCPRVSPRLVR